MDLIAFKFLFGEGGEEAVDPLEPSMDPRPRLLIGERGGDGEEPQAPERAAVLDAKRIPKLLAQHLIAPAYTKDRAAICRKMQDPRFQAVLAKPEKVGHGIFRAGKDDEVGFAELADGLHIPHRDAVDRLQRPEIREIRDMRQMSMGAGVLFVRRPERLSSSSISKCR